MTEFFKDHGFDLSPQEQLEWADSTIQEEELGQPSFWGDIIRTNQRNQGIIQAGKGNSNLIAQIEAVEDALINTFGQHLPRVKEAVSEVRKPS